MISPARAAPKNDQARHSGLAEIRARIHSIARTKGPKTNWPPKEKSTSTPKGNASAEITAAIFDSTVRSGSPGPASPALRRYSRANSSGDPSLSASADSGMSRSSSARSASDFLALPRRHRPAGLQRDPGSWPRYRVYQICSLVHLSSRPSIRSIV